MEIKISATFYEVNFALSSLSQGPHETGTENNKNNKSNIRRETSIGNTKHLFKTEVPGFPFPILTGAPLCMHTFVLKWFFRPCPRLDTPVCSSLLCRVTMAVLYVSHNARKTFLKIKVSNFQKPDAQAQRRFLEEVIVVYSLL